MGANGMISRWFLGLVTFGLVLSAHAQEVVPRPNIVVILVDDAALMDFGVYGGEARTPNMDALAASGGSGDT